MVEVAYSQKELEEMVELARALMYGNPSMRRKLTKLLGEYLQAGRIKSAEEVRRDLSKIKGSLSEEIIKMRYAE